MVRRFCYRHGLGAEESERTTESRSKEGEREGGEKVVIKPMQTPILRLSLCGSITIGMALSYHSPTILSQMKSHTMQEYITF